MLQRLQQFYEEVQNKRKNRNMRLQVHNEFQQVKVKDSNDKYNVTMLTTSIRDGKAFAAQQKIMEIKSRIAKLKPYLTKTRLRYLRQL